MPPMIEFQNVQIQRGGRVLIEDASFQLYPKQRMALTGVNGCGKSTLFEVILESHSIDQGEVRLQPKINIAYMAQEIEQINRTAVEHILDGYELFRQLEKQQALAEANNDDQLLSQTLADLDEISAYALENKAQTILLGLGFAPSDYNKAVSEFSGGWRIRLNLARALFSPSDLLLLDEPTNHLDIEAIHFLEQWLNQYPGAALIISHDRDFIDSSCNRLANIEHQNFKVYTGNYSSFEKQRAEHLQLQQSLLEKQQRRQKELQQFIDRFKAKATKAKQAQSRIKALEKMQPIQIVREQSPYQFRLPCSEKISSPLLSFSQASIGYGNNAILQGCNLSILPGQRIGLLGSNGAGKSTLIKTLAQLQPLINGESSQGEHLRIGYFAQHQLESLDLNASAILHIQRLSPEAREQEIRDFLGSFSIRGDQATSEIKPFSGGEKARLALAIIAWQKPNLLLLDEPTNHLDIAMREALADAIQAYEGAVLLDSHDRYLLRHCVDDFWLVHDGKLEEFNGDIEDYYAWRESQLNQDNSRIKEKPSASKKQARADAAAIRKQLSPLKNEVTKHEKAIDDIETKLESLREKLSDSDIYSEENKDQLKKLLDDEKKLKQQLEESELNWEQALEALENAESAIQQA